MMTNVLLSVSVLAMAPAFAAIRVNANFEGGSVGRVETVAPAHLRCGVAGQADHDNRNRQASWYYFELTGLPREEVAIDLVDLAGEYDYKAPAYAVTKGTRPVYSYDRAHWTHFTDDQVTWDDRQSILRLHFTPTANRMWIAHVPPYGNAQAAALKGADLERQVIGRTVEGRDIQLWTITNRRVPDAGKKVIWLMFRQHAWESGSSWAADGAVRHLLSPEGARLRDGAIFKIFPIADPDGVAAGRVRYNKNGYDLNRNWDVDDPKLMPEIAAQRKAIFDWLDSGHPIDIFLSLHNTETGEYLQAPEEFRALGERIRTMLVERTTFNPTVPLRFTGAAEKGRMNVAQGLYRDRKIPAMLMEQMVQYNAKLKRCPTVADRTKFGAGLAEALYDALH
jgi:hypothetical protein